MLPTVLGADDTTDISCKAAIELSACRIVNASKHVFPLPCQILNNISTNNVSLTLRYYNNNYYYANY